MFKQKQLATSHGKKKDKLKKIVKSQKRKKKRGAPDYSSPAKRRANKKMKEASVREKHHKLECVRIKNKLGYRSPEASSCSSSDEDAFSTQSNSLDQT